MSVLSPGLADTLLSAGLCDGSVPSRLEVLLVAPEARARAVAGALERLGGDRFGLRRAACLDQATEILRKQPQDLLIVELALSRPESTDILLRARLIAHRLPLVLVFDQEDVDLALQAVQDGVQDVLHAPAELNPGLGAILRHAVARHRIVTGLRNAFLTSSTSTFHDPLTGLANRSSFLRRCREALALAERFRDTPALLLVRIDDLERVRERHGTVAAARLIREAGRRLTWCVRRSDLAGRMGTDCFAVFLPQCRSYAAGRMVVERMRHALDAPYELEETAVRTAARIGLAWYPSDGRTEGELVEAAAAALPQHGEPGSSGTLFRPLEVPPWPGAEAPEQAPGGAATRRP